MKTISIDRPDPTLEKRIESGGYWTAPRRCPNRAQGRRQVQGAHHEGAPGKICVTPGCLSQIATGRKRWTAETRQKAEAALGEVPAQGFVERQEDAVAGRAAASAKGRGSSAGACGTWPNASECPTATWCRRPGTAGS